MAKKRSRSFVEPKILPPILNREIKIRFDWKSFDDLFNSLINEEAEEVIETIVDSLISKECAISLIQALIEHCKPPNSEKHKVTKHEMIRNFLQQTLKEYVIKYSDDPRETGYYKNGVLVDVVEIDVTDQEEINWIFRDITKNIETCTELQQFIIENYYLDEIQKRIKGIMYVDIAIEIDWASIDYAAKDFSKAVLSLYYDKSTYVLEEIFQAIEYICSYEEDDLVDSIAMVNLLIKKRVWRR
jgi:hypothetical protein